MSKLVAVIGASGKQGSGVINAILDDPKAKSRFSLRGLTRDPTSAKAKALQERGVEVVAADVGQLDTLITAFKDVDAVFAVTDYWAKASKQLEMQQGRNIVDACKANKVDHLIWSTIDNVTKVTNGKYAHVEHFDGKAEIDDYIESVGVPATYFMPGFYMSNLPGGMLRYDASAKRYIIRFPIKAGSVFPLFDAAGDTGKFVKAILINGESMIGKRVRGATKYYSTADIINTFKEMYPEDGKDAEYVEVPAAGFKKGLEAGGMPPAVQEDLCEMLQYIGEFGYYNGAKLDDSLALLDEEPTTLAEFFRHAPAFKDLK